MAAKMAGLSEILNLSRWRKDRRIHPRTELPTLMLIASWRRFEARDWSLGGCLIEAPPGAFKVGDHVEGKMEIRGSNERGEFLAEVVRAKDSGEFGLRWLEVSVNLFAEMASVKMG
jgi:hypothetical protein